MSPAPSLLSREQIVATAIMLLDNDGVDRFSMRRLGAQLGVDPMAIYYHLPSKSALFDAVVDAVWAQTAVERPSAGASWQQIVAQLIGALRQTLLAHPRLVPIIATRPLVTRSMLALVEQALGDLADAGLPPASAMQLLDCLVGYTVGKVQGEVRDPVGGSGEAPEAAYAALTPDTHPNLVAALQAGYDWAPDEEFNKGLQAMIAGWQPDAAVEAH